ncbi:Ubiquitin-conjugating enzyme E2 [Dillenia turbinata]|uniref:E2 ubiquitin-conjugating enzyme n=1 Tax=Dillenia turbinata TaxID=194707 RepID=A0AAN8VFL0_9MAGN
MDIFLSDSDCESFTESSSIDDQDDTESIFGGQAQSILSSLEETIGKIDDFLSFERGFVHGDIVSSTNDPSGQMGKVVEIEMLVNLEDVHGKVIKDVNTKELTKIRSISVGDFVVHGPWLGRVNKVMDRVTILFDDGTKSEFVVEDQEKVVPISPDLLEDPQYPYYPGQRVQIKQSAASKSARWLCGTWKEVRDQGTVCAVEAGWLCVNWLTSALLGSNFSLPAPPSMLDAKSITLLSCFSHATWQLGDWCLRTVSNHEEVKEQNFLNGPIGHNVSEKGFKRRDLNSNLKELFVIAKTKTKVDVLWQDGSCSIGLDSQSLSPVSVVNDYEFLPAQFVLEKGTCDDQHASSGQKWGIVRRVDAKERTVNVRWSTSLENHANEVKRAWIEETVSAYELVEHPDYSFYLGEVVFMLIGQADGQICKDPENLELCRGDNVDLKNNFSNMEWNTYSSEFYLSCIGNVMGLKDGYIEVKWARGVISKVAPYEIFRMDKYDGSAATSILPELNNDELNEETVELEKQAFHHKGEEILEFGSVGEGCKKCLKDSTAFFCPQSAIRFFKGIAASLFGSLGPTRTSDQASLSSIPENLNGYRVPHEEFLESRNVCSEETLLLDHDIEKVGEEKSTEQVEEALDNEEPSLSSGSNSPKQFRQFDMVTDCSDHHFVNGAGKGLPVSQVKRGWLRKVQQEWNILQNDLPDTIYVRAYEDRMDLLRAAIVGSPGTPYHDALFFFDIFLPPDFPHEPPMVHYISGGLRVNPNLYESGKVCLSLLNTWTGTGSEVWNPGESTILQVLLSLQALVLNEKPYFNEAGYDMQVGRVEGEKNSISYNENAFLLTCKSMLYVLQKPPKHFEALVEEHFSQRAQLILSACKAYMEGAAVGFAFGNKDAVQDNKLESSKGFKLMLAKLFDKLIAAFDKKGIDCSQFIASEI